MKQEPTVMKYTANRGTEKKNQRLTFKKSTKADKHLVNSQEVCMVERGEGIVSLRN